MISRSTVLPLATIFAICSYAIVLPTARAFTVESTTGDITPNEISSFISSINGLTPATSNYGNEMATHNSGTWIAGISRMYESTQNVAILNKAITFADTFLAYRNDQPLGPHQIQWTGKIEPVWPLDSSANAGGETGQVAGHIGYVAYLILKTPSLAGSTVPDGNPHGFGATYQARALTYLRMIDETVNGYIIPYCVDPVSFKTKNPSFDPATGSVPPWNIQSMFMEPLLYAARCHDLLQDKPANLATCKAVVNEYATWFVASGSYYTSPDGHPVVGYYYMPPTSTARENQGHAQHDMRGLLNAYESGYTAVTSDQMTVFANTARYVMNLSPTTWSDNVEGTGPVNSSLKPDFARLAKFDRDLFPLQINSAIAAGNITSGSETCLNTGLLLNMKHWLFLQAGGMLEAEELPIQGSSGQTVRIIADPSFRGGQAVVYDAVATGNYLTFTVNLPEIRTYNVRIGVRTFSTRGIYQMSVAPGGVSKFDNHGSPMDFYSASTAYTEIDAATFSIGTAGDKSFRFTAVGKNAQSSGYTLCVDYIRIIPQ